MSLRSFVRLGAAVSLFGMTSLGSSLSVLDFMNCGSTLALRSFVRFGSALSIGAGTTKASKLNIETVSGDVRMGHMDNAWTDEAAATGNWHQIVLTGNALEGTTGNYNEGGTKDRPAGILHGTWEVNQVQFKGTAEGIGLKHKNLQNSQLTINSGTDGGGKLHGQWVSTNAVTVSDKRLKRNVQPLLKALRQSGAVKSETEAYPMSALLQDLRPVAFSYTSSASSMRFGFLADEVGQILPQLLRDIPGANGGSADKPLRGLVYQDLIAVLIEAVSEQSRRLDSLERLVRTLVPSSEV